MVIINFKIYFNFNIHLFNIIELLFLCYISEPTSGLDSSTAYTIISLLKSLTKQNQTILLTIHSTSWNIIYNTLIQDLSRVKILNQHSNNNIPLNSSLSRLFHINTYLSPFIRVIDTSILFDSIEKLWQQCFTIKLKDENDSLDPAAAAAGGLQGKI